MRLRTCVFSWTFAVLLLGLPAHGVEEARQSQMLRRMFTHKQAEWVGILRQNAGLLDSTFFERVDARIRWSCSNQQVDDAIRFAIMGDLASDIVGRSGGYRLVLALACQNAGDDAAAQRLCNAILLTYPKDSVARQIFEIVASTPPRQPGGETPTLYPDSAFAPRGVVRRVSIEVENPAPRKVDPARHLDYFSRGELAARAGQLAAAEEFYQDACAADPRRANYWLAAGALQYRLGRTELALVCIRRGLNSNSKSVDGWRFLGCCYERQFDRSHSATDLGFARTAFEKVLELRPGEAVARMALERLSAKGKPAGPPCPAAQP